MAAPFLSLLFMAPAADGWLGIYLDTTRDEPVVGMVMADSPAQKAGLQIGDVLLAVGGKNTATRDDFVAAIRAAKAGDRVTLKIRRGDQQQEVAVVLGERPEQAPAPATGQTKAGQPQAPGQPPAPAHESKRAAAADGRGYLGVRVGEADDGVVVQTVLEGGPAAKAGVMVGERITSVGDTRIGSLSDLDQALHGAPAGRELALGLRGEKGSRSLMLTLGRRPAAEGGAMAAPAPIATAPMHEKGHEKAPEKAHEERAHEDAAGAKSPAHDRKVAELETELANLRAELADLRKQLDALRKAKGRE